MAHKRYLVLPADGIRLSDTPARPQSARHLLETLQPGKKAAVRSLGRQLSASLRSAHGTGPVAAMGAGAAAASAPSAAAPAASRITVVKSLGEDSVKLVEAPPALMTLLRQQNPGVRVVEETFCHRALAPRVAVPQRRAKAAKRRGPSGPRLTITVVRGDNGEPVRGADVVAFRTDEDALERRTNRAGTATFGFGRRVTRLRSVYVYHEEAGVWGYFKTNVTVRQNAVRIRLATLDLAAVDALRHFHGAGSPRHGKGVRVGVIDDGADTAHPDLEDAIEGGANCVPESAHPVTDFGPDGAHGTHVAGTIAARGKAPTGVRGIAPGARLRIYRVFEDGNEGSGSSFAIIDAIERAIRDRCDIVNLSLSFDRGVTDPAVADALRKARNRGMLVVAAAGNDNREEVSFPASDDASVAVSATGRKGLFPRTATETDDIAAPFGRDRRNFLGGFSNVGPDLDITGSGVGVVSTFPGGYGVMSGTSMASPAVAGLAARLLGARPRIRRMRRNAARSDAIRGLLVQAAAPLGFGILFEGAGLPR
jgi:subtilisin